MVIAVQSDVGEEKSTAWTKDMHVITVKYL